MSSWLEPSTEAPAIKKLQQKLEDVAQSLGLDSPFALAAARNMLRVHVPCRKEREGGMGLGHGCIGAEG